MCASRFLEELYEQQSASSRSALCRRRRERALKASTWSVSMSIRWSRKRRLCLHFNPWPSLVKLSTAMANFLPGTASLLEDLDSKLFVSHHAQDDVTYWFWPLLRVNGILIAMYLYRRETYSPFKRWKDSDWLFAQYRPICKSRSASYNWAHSYWRQVRRHS